MTEDQDGLVAKARDSIRGAELMARDGLYDFAVSRAYYAMFYAAEALLLGEGLQFSSHAAVSPDFEDKGIFERVELTAEAEAETIRRFVVPLDIVMFTPAEYENAT